MVKKLALLVGCNYNNKNVPKENKLHGCVNDVNAMQTLIRHRFGFRDENITIWTDEPGTKKLPTSSNIIRELETKVKATKPGDTLLFYFSGGGARVTPRDKNETIPVIVPYDLKPIAGVVEDSIRAYIECGSSARQELPASSVFIGAHILKIIKEFPATVICDSSYSGGLFQKIDAQIKTNVAENKPNFGSKTIPPNILQPIDGSVYPPNNGNTLTFSSSEEKSVEVNLNGDTSKAFSAYSSAIQALFNSPKLVKTNSDVEAFTTKLLDILDFGQQPRYDSIPNNAAALFLGG